MKLWHYRGAALAQVEWGLWRDTTQKGRYFLCYRPQGRKGPVVRRWAYTGPALSVKDLRDHVRRVRSEIEAHKIGLQPLEPLGQAVDNYVADLERRNLSEGHVSDVKAVLERFRTAAGDVGIAEVEVGDVEGFLASLGAVSARTQNKCRGHIYALFEWAVKRGVADRNVVVGVGRAKEEHTAPEFPMPEVFKKIVDKSSREDAALWVFLAFTGLRRGSLLAMKRQDITDAGIHVRHTKRRREWWIALDDGCPLWGPELAEVGRLALTPEPTAKTLRTRFEATCKAAGVSYTVNALRHAFCSWLALMGEDLADIQAWMHHTTSRTTAEWYRHLRPRGRERLAANRADVFTMCSHALAKALIGPLEVFLTEGMHRV